VDFIGVRRQFSNTATVVGAGFVTATALSAVGCTRKMGTAFFVEDSAEPMTKSRVGPGRT
jgi:hypothetical protein